MLISAREHFANDSTVKIIEHDLSQPLPDLDYFDAVVSSFAIHHLKHERKRSLYEEIYDILNPTGIFCNLEHVASPSVESHIRFLSAIGYTPGKEDKANRLLPMETQLGWFRELGFVEVDCYWKWLEIALQIGYIERTQRGRIVTAKAYDHLGIRPPGLSATAAVTPDLFGGDEHGE